MKKAVFLTAYNRPEYFRQTMNTWRQVRGLEDWHFVVRLEPGPDVSIHEDITFEAQQDFKVVVNPHTYGVLHHPWVGFEDLFLNYDFVVRAEDDLPVSNDILEYFSWAAEQYASDEEIAAIVGFNGEEGHDPSTVLRKSQFSPWVWGTWKNRWEDYIRDTWDHNYSTFNGHPGNQAGWDWNLNTRVLPERGKKCIYPEVSRVDNIGVWGVHGTPDNLTVAKTFVQRQEPVKFQER